MEATQAMIPIILFISMSLTIFGIFYLRNKENMALIERGINPREGFRKFGSLTYLKYGLLLVGSGLGLAIAYALDVHFFRNIYSAHDNPGLYFSLVAVGGGIGLIISYFIEKKEMEKHTKQD